MTRVLVVALVALAALAGAVTALATFRIDRKLDVGSVRLSVDPGHRGSLDLYVPLVDWGVRFPVVRLPARVNVDVRSIDREAVTQIAGKGELDAGTVREQATAALSFYLRWAILVAGLSALALGVLVALAARGGNAPPLRVGLATAGATSAAVVALLVVALPPRSNIDDPQYYANGPEVPAALRTLASIGASSRTLDDELDEQLVGIARLVTAPANRTDLSGDLPRLTVASDLHNNVIALAALERAASGGPLLFAGDLTDRGTPIERKLVLRVARLGTRLVFVSGNHDSDVLERQLARAGAVVLTRDGRLNPDGSTGPLVVTVGGLRIAGYDDPLKRLAREDYEDRGARPTERDQREFATWLRGLAGRVDIVMVHEPGLAQRAVDALRADPPAAPLVIVWGHTHRTELQHAGTLTTLNPGSLGAGGTGNLADDGGDIGLARLIYEPDPRFAALAADLVQIDPGTGSAQARRYRLDERDDRAASAG